MPQKRARGNNTMPAQKRRRPNNKRPCTLMDLDLVSKDDYVIIGDFMFVRPYVFEFKMNFKPRWKNKSIQDVFCEEFKHADEEYWAREVRERRILANGEPISSWTPWDDGIEVVHTVHRHESAVLAAGIQIVRNEEGFIVVSKPPSIPVHPCGTYRRNSLQFVLKAFHNTGKLFAVHRLDKETSGLVIFAKQPSSAARFSAEIKEHKVQKTYLAEVHGIFPSDISECSDSIYWDKRDMKASIKDEGQEAKTSFKVVSVNAKRHTTIVECRPLTGRTHQIRVHLAHLGYSIVNDPLYGDHAATETTTLVSAASENPSAVTLSHAAFKDEREINERRRTYLGCDWNKRSLKEEGRHLTCPEEGRKLSCTNCPQVTNVKNVGVQAMFIHLHALKYESENWSFAVPPPPWMITKEEAPANVTAELPQRSGGACSMS